MNPMSLYLNLALSRTLQTTRYCTYHQTFFLPNVLRKFEPQLLYFLSFLVVCAYAMRTEQIKYENHKLANYCKHHLVRDLLKINNFPGAL
jgi:hypothetical protein